MNRRRTKRSARPWYLYVLAAIAIAAVVMGITNLGVATSSSARTSTEVVTAADGVVQDTVSGTGSVEPGVDDDVNFATSGTLTSTNVKVGEHVTKGELLATLDPSSAEIALAEAKATLTSAEDAVTSAQDADSTAVDVSDSSSTTTSDGSSASSAATVASDELQVESDKAAVTADEATVADTKLYAPVSGTIAATAGDAVGESVSSGTDSSDSADDSTSSSTDTDSSDTSSDSSTAFAEIINSKTMTMTVSLSESDISAVKVGQSATVSFSALSGVELAARVTSISPLGTEDDDVVSYDVMLTIHQQNSKVLPGMSATAAIVTSQAQGVTVPTEAVTGSGTDATVDLYKDGKVTTQSVVVGLSGSSRDVILSGLKAGQEVQITIDLPALGTSTTSTTSTTSATSEFGGGAAGAAGAGGGFAGRGAGAP